ncbi:ATP-dependent RNA helicase [Lysobacteraceae bacterium NML93-0792]|nr:ATP-dependent RNA helicase [Xanthomonadaceae bacterium NML93-0792]PBS14318.1 ATP-dependent RNA helicase [Xanthomonadaceae bacterium NML93-0793]PBS17532.1 ATP-dependent RNA helicase [Xanthomonadaceae bacterium NML93-0831]
MSAESPITPADTPKFTDLALPEPLLRALAAVGYESPSPIQAATIPPLLDGRDVLGQAQTGTGKTAAFALPVLARIDPSAKKPQALVLAPTRELAIQVAEAFHKYAAHMPGFQVLPIYGGQGYAQQLSALKRGVQVIVGTPGRVIDHLERGSLDLSELRALVLDEADEMLRMGFIDDVEAVLKKTPDSRQVALFSATMPSQIKHIAQTYLKDPVEIAIKATTTTAANIRQRYWMVSGVNKLDALTRILEAEPFDAMIIFARTKLATEELAQKLSARGLSAAAINGDLDQKQRERAIQNLKDGRLDVLVATDVAARGLDVERISHVLNYDIPYDTESYVHRIGRTGRAGRSGEAILFVAPRERGMLGAIERATRQKIEQMQLPSVETVNEARVGKFLDKITAALSGSDLGIFRDLVERYEREHNVPAAEIAAALAKVVQGETPLLLEPPRKPEKPAFEREFVERPGGREASRAARESREPRPPRADSGPRTPDVGMETFRIEVGYVHGVQPGNIVGAIANEADLESKYIGRIDIRDDYSLVDLPEGMPRELLEHLKKVRIAGQAIRMRRAEDADLTAAPPRGKRPFGAKPGGRPGGFKPGGPRKGPPRRDPR